MQNLDWFVLIAFFMIMVVIGFWSFGKINNSKDFFVADGKMPWWLSGVSHHVSGYSGAVFVAYAGLAYTHGISLYIWWALPVFLACFVGAFIMAPRWARLRIKLDIESPTEYLAMRYNVSTQQVMAWSGVLLKLFDVGAKWAAIAILLNVFTGTPLVTGILLSGGISLVYITIGGIWADVWTDFAQFVIQVLAGLTMFFIVITKLGGVGSIGTIWAKLPEANSQPFHEPYTAGFVTAFVFIVFLSYNGGTWNLATRYISSPSGSDAKKSALLSAGLYLIWPLILFFPMWAAPIFLPNIDDPNQSYALLTKELLPPGLIGLVLASLFAATMSMTSSDSNTISSVITRDILPVMSKRFQRMNQKQSLKMARIATFTFTALTLLIAIYSDVFGGVIGLLLIWFAALVGPISIPMLFGLLPAFKHCNSKAAIISILAGLVGFILVNYGLEASLAGKMATPVLTSAVIYTGMGWFNRKKPVKPELTELFDALDKDTNVTEHGKQIPL